MLIYGNTLQTIIYYLRFDIVIQSLLLYIQLISTLNTFSLYHNN